jgi:hypothetical protein
MYANFLININQSGSHNECRYNYNKRYNNELRFLPRIKIKKQDSGDERNYKVN